MYSEADDLTAELSNYKKPIHFQMTIKILVVQCVQLSTKNSLRLHVQWQSKSLNPLDFYTSLANLGVGYPLILKS